MTQATIPPNSRTPVLHSQVIPKRAQHIRPGDVVSPKRGEAYRVEDIREVPGTIYFQGEWVDLTAPNSQPQPFTLYFIRFYSVLMVSAHD